MKLLADFFPVLLFFLAYKLYGILVATAVAIVASALQVGIGWWRHRTLETMHLVTLGLLVVFGGLTLLLQDPVFIMWKPSIVNWLFALAFLGSQFIGERTLVERMMSHAIQVPGPVWRRLNQLWVGFFVAMGAANLLVASRFFTVLDQLHQAGGTDPVDTAACAARFQGELLALCQRAAELEATWVDFKLFGMLGLTILFIIAQGFYLARHIQDAPAQPE
jgi:intracellular septation protein